MHVAVCWLHVVSLARRAEQVRRGVGAGAHARRLAAAALERAAGPERPVSPAAGNYCSMDCEVPFTHLQIVQES